MDHRKVYQATAGLAMSAIIFMTSNIVSVNATGSHITDIMDGIQLEVIENEHEKLIKPPQENKHPLTWGSFINKMSTISGTGEDQILQILRNGNRRYLPLVMTKAQIAHNYKVLLEFQHQGRLDSRNYASLITVIQEISPRRNYILNEEMDALVKQFPNYSIYQGVIREEMRGTLSHFDGNGSITFDIIKGASVQKRTFKLNPRTPWKVHNGVYKLVSEGDTLIAIDSSDTFQYGIVKNNPTGLTIGEHKLPFNISNTMSGDYIEYAVDMEDNVTVLRNLGRPDYQVIRSTDAQGKITTYDGIISAEKYNIINNEGVPMNYSELKPLDLLGVTEDTLVVSNTGKDVTIKLIGNTFIAEDMVYSADGLVITDGIFVNNAQDWKYKDLVNKGNVIFDLEGNPRVVKIENIEYPGIATGLGTEKVRVLSLGENEYDMPYTMQSQINLDELYNFIVVDNKVIKADKLPTIRGNVKTLNANFINVAGKSYTVNPNTPVLMIDTAIKEEKVTTDTINTATTDKKGINYESKHKYISTTYRDILTTYKDLIGTGSIDVEFIEIYNQIGVMKVKFLPEHKLNFNNHIDENKSYTIKSIDEVGPMSYIITLDNDAKFSYKGFLANEIGDSVSLKFDRQGNLISIRTAVK